MKHYSHVDNNKIFLDTKLDKLFNHKKNGFYIELGANNGLTQSKYAFLEKNRNWHWMWSTFYFHKKHYGYLTAIIKILPKLSSSLIKFIIFLITFQKYKSEIYKHRLSGIINSVLLRKSWYRPKL